MAGYTVKWNDKVKLIITDVDDTISDMFSQISPELLYELEKLLEEGKIIFFISGQGINNIYNRVIKHIKNQFLDQVLVAHCNGSEVYSFNKHGELIQTPIFTIYNLIGKNIDKIKIRDSIRILLEHFNLEPYSIFNLNEFKKVTCNKANCIMLDDRDVQISIDFINSLYSGDFVIKGQTNTEKHTENDIRNLVILEAKKIFLEYGLPLEANIAGTCAIDFNFTGVNKGLPIRHIVKFGNKFNNMLPNSIELSGYDEVEIWGDSFSLINRGSDRYMSLALPKEVRSISFRDFEVSSIRDEYNIVQWNGKYRCCKGVIEYLKSR